MDKISEKIFNSCRIPQELLITKNSNLSSIKIQQEQFNKKLEKQIK